jgi:formylglycine-generating enzyme required for sulfatase activity
MIRAFVVAALAATGLHADTGPAAPVLPAVCTGSDADAPARVPASRFRLGDKGRYPEEGPPTDTIVPSFDVDAHEVTNRQFIAFVAATGYRTMAEQPGGGAFVFTPPARPFDTPDPVFWWRFVEGANWRHPRGPGSTIVGRDNEPVVDVTFADAAAYAAWAGRALPTEEQFEAAARIGVGDPEAAPELHAANYWQGAFPSRDTGEDGWIGPAPAGCFDRSPIGTYDLIGNVWEWTSSWYLPSHGTFVTGDGTPGNPSFDPSQPDARARVIKGGSFLCADNYCARYRPAARHAQDETLAASHLGFRTVSVRGIAR